MMILNVGKDVEQLKLILLMSQNITTLHSHVSFLQNFICTSYYDLAILLYKMIYTGMFIIVSIRSQKRNKPNVHQQENRIVQQNTTQE